MLKSAKQSHLRSAACGRIEQNNKSDKAQNKRKYMPKQRAMKKT